MHERVRASVSRAVPSQRVQASGEAQLAVLGGAPGPAAWHLAVAGVLSDGRVRLDGGLLHGLHPNARMALHRAGAEPPSDENRLARGVVVDPSATTALLLLDERDRAAGDLSTARAYLAERPAASLALRIDGPGDWVNQWTRRARDADFVPADSAELELILDRDEVRLERSTAGAPLGTAKLNDPAGTERIARTLRRLVSAHRALAQPLEDPAFAIDVRVFEATPGTCEVTREIGWGRDEPDGRYDSLTGDTMFCSSAYCQGDVVEAFPAD